MKKRNLPFILGFCLLLAGMQTAFWLLPKADFSANEKRVLQKMPSFSWDALWRGKWFGSLDDYLSDHFAGRDFWVGLHAYTEQAEGLNAAGEVYRGKNDWLLNKPIETGKIFDQNMQILSEFAAQHPDTPLSFLCIPTTGAMLPQELPRLHDVYPDAEILDEMQENLQNMQWIDVQSALQGRTDAFYRTDHHWTSRGAYAAYQVLAKTWKMTAAEESAYKITDYDGFYGTTYSKSGLWATPPDTLSVWEDTETDIHVTVYDENRPIPTEQDGAFFLEHLQDTDKYPVFLDGNHARVTLTSNAKGGKLLIVRDSFAHCLAPFLSRHFQTVDLVDLRYFKRQTVSELMQENGYDRVLFVYGLESLTDDRSLQWLQ